MRHTQWAVCAAAWLALAPFARAHCEIPCGIYGDRLRIEQLREDVATLEKSAVEIVRLSGEERPDHHQLVRWVTNKEAHATKLQDTVSRYFLHQRIKPVEPGAPGREAYVRQLTLLHGILLQAMKAKQTTAAAPVAELRELIDAFEAAYFGPAAREHLEDGHAH